MAKNQNPDYIYQLDSKGRRRAFVKKPCAYCHVETLLRPNAQYCSYACSARGRDVQKYLPREPGAKHHNTNPDSPYHGVSAARRTGEQLPGGFFSEKGLKAHYNWGINDKENLLKNQDGKCLFCPEPLIEPITPKGKSRYDVDHDHTHCAGTFGCAVCIRAILCHRHNTAIGLAGDDPETLRAMADYIEEHRKRINESS